MRKNRFCMALSAVAIYQGLVWLADFAGTLFGSLLRGKAPGGILMQWTTGIRLPQTLLVVLLIVAAAFLNRRHAGRPEPEVWYAAGGFLCIRAIFGLLPVAIELAGILAQPRPTTDTRLLTTSLAYLASPLVESLLKLLFFLLAWRIGSRLMHETLRRAQDAAPNAGSAHTLAMESIVLSFGFTLTIQCIGSAAMLLLSETMRENAANPAGWVSFGLQAMIIAGLAAWLHRRKSRTQPPQPLLPMALWITGMMLCVSTLLSLPTLILTLRMIVPPQAATLDSSFLHLQRLAFAVNVVFSIVSAGMAVSAIALGERAARRSEAAGQNETAGQPMEKE